MLEAHVAGCVDAPVGRAQEVVDDDAVIGVVGDSRGLEVEAADRRGAADPGQDVVDRDRRDVAVVDRLDVLLAALDATCTAARVEMDLDAVARERFGTICAASRSSFGRNSGALWAITTRAAEARQRLRHLAADRAAADDEQARRQRGQVEDRFVGQVAGFGQPGNRRQHRARAGGDDRLLEAQARAVDVDGVAAREARGAEEHVDAALGEALAESARPMRARIRRMRSITVAKSTRMSPGTHAP